MIIPFHQRRPQRHRPSGFTLVEALLVVGLIAVLMSILIPVVSGVRKRGYEVRTRALMEKLASAIRVYQGDFRAYPGPLPNAIPGSGGLVTLPVGMTITSTENLTLGLLGGLDAPPTTFTPSQRTQDWPPSGPLSLNPANPKRYHAYIDYAAGETDWDPTKKGSYKSQYGYLAPNCTDSDVPEFVDAYSEPMPILYLRARPGAKAVINDGSDAVYGPATPSQFNIDDITVYTGEPNQGTAKNALKFVPTSPPSHTYFESWYDAFRNDSFSPIDPATGNAPPVSTTSPPEIARGKDSFLLIAAGSSRIWLARDTIFVGQ